MAMKRKTRILTFLPNLLLPILMISLAVQFADSQGHGTDQLASSRSPVRLLPGYKLQIVPGPEGSGGKIWKEGGPVIDFNLPQCCAGIATDSVEKGAVAWRIEQIVEKQRVIVLYTNSNELIVAFPKLISNFHAKIRNPQDLAEVLLMVLTFEPYKGYEMDPGRTLK